MTFTHTATGQTISDDASVAVNHQGIIILFQGGFGAIGEAGFAGLDSLITTRFGDTVSVSVVPSGGASNTLVDPFDAFEEQENAAKGLLSPFLNLFPEAKVVLFGFSFGGDTATLSTIPSNVSFCRNGSTSCLVITLDPISRHKAKEGVFDQSALPFGVSGRTQINYRQNWAGCSIAGVFQANLRGYEVVGATNFSVDFRQRGHCDIDDDTFMQGRTVDDIEAFLKKP